MIHVENLSKYYGDLCAVDQINFDIQKGEIVGLLGPNGAGKTTTLRMLTCFLLPSMGTITVKDFAIDEAPLEIKKLIGYLPESAPLYYDMLVYDYLDFVANIRALEKEKKASRIRELGNLCGLNTVMHKPIGELSKGYKQRVGLAHAMMNDPEILILDEPTSGLDPNQIIEIRNIIKEIGKEKTIILSTHILSEAEATCDRIVIINHGKIVADRSTESLKQSAGEEIHIHLSFQNADFDAVQKELNPITGIKDITHSNGENDLLNITLTCDSRHLSDPLQDVRKDIYKKIKETDWILLEFYQETQTLENIFRQLTMEK